MNKWLVILLALELTGCATQATLEKPTGLSNADLRHRSWVNQVSGDDTYVLMIQNSRAANRYGRLD